MTIVGSYILNGRVNSRSSGMDILRSLWACLLLFTEFALAADSITGCPKYYGQHGLQANFYSYPYKGSGAPDEPRSWFLTGYNKTGKYLGSQPNVTKVDFTIKAPPKNNVMGLVYGFPVTIAHFAVEVVGYYHPSVTGDHTFTLGDCDDGASMQIGMAEQQTCCSNDFNSMIDSTRMVVRYNKKAANGNRTYHLIEGNYYPIRIAYYNIRGGGFLRFSVQTPDSSEPSIDLVGNLLAPNGSCQDPPLPASSLLPKSSTISSSSSVLSWSSSSNNQVSGSTSISPPISSLISTQSSRASSMDSSRISPLSSSTAQKSHSSHSLVSSSSLPKSSIEIFSSRLSSKSSNFISSKQDFTSSSAVFSSSPGISSKTSHVTSLLSTRSLSSYQVLRSSTGSTKLTTSASFSRASAKPTISLLSSSADQSGSHIQSPSRSSSSLFTSSSLQPSSGQKEVPSSAKSWNSFSSTDPSSSSSSVLSTSTLQSSSAQKKISSSTKSWNSISSTGPSSSSSSLLTRSTLQPSSASSAQKKISSTTKSSNSISSTGPSSSSSSLLTNSALQSSSAQKKISSTTKSSNSISSTGPSSSSSSLLTNSALQSSSAQKKISSTTKSSNSILSTGPSSSSSSLLSSSTLQSSSTQKKIPSTTKSSNSFLSTGLSSSSSFSSICNKSSTQSRVSSKSYGVSGMKSYSARSRSGASIVESSAHESCVTSTRISLISSGNIKTDSAAARRTRYSSGSSHSETCSQADSLQYSRSLNPSVSQDRSSLRSANSPHFTISWTDSVSKFPAKPSSSGSIISTRNGHSLENSICTNCESHIRPMLSREGKSGGSEVFTKTSTLKRQETRTAISIGNGSTEGLNNERDASTKRSSSSWIQAERGISPSHRSTTAVTLAQTSKRDKANLASLPVSATKKASGSGNMIVSNAGNRNGISQVAMIPLLAMSLLISALL